MTSNEHPTLKFIYALFQNCTEGILNLRVLSRIGEKAESHFLNLNDERLPDKIISIVNYQKKDTGVYLGMASRIGNNGTKEGIKEIPALWIEHDNVTSRVQEKIDTFPLEPSVIIQSSFEYKKYCIWFLKEPANKSEISKVENLLERLRQYFDSDPSSCDASRILRLPGTLNYGKKDKPYNPCMPCLLQEIHPERQYSLEDFESLLPQIMDVATIQNKEPIRERIESKVREGERNATITREAGRLITMGLSRTEALYTLNGINNNQCEPPLESKEIETILDSVSKTHSRNHQEPCLSQKSDEQTRIITLQDTSMSYQPSIDLTFPAETIQGVCKEFADIYSSYLESPWQFFVIAFLNILGCMLSDRITLKSQLIVQPRLYAVLLGESGDTRKSEAIKQTVRYFDTHFPNQDIGFCFGVGSAEGLAVFLNEHSRTILIFDELKTFVNKSNIDGAILLPAITTLFESNKFHSQTKQHKIELNDIYLSMLSASTLDTFERMFTPAFRDIGFLNRLFLVPGDSERKYAIPGEIPIYSQNTIADHLRENLRRIPASGVIDINKGASALFSEWYKSPDNKGLYSTRLEAYGLRLLELFAVNEGKSAINEDMVERVIKILNWQRLVREVYDPDDSENVVAKLEAKIKKTLLISPCDKRTIMRRANANRYGTYFFNMALNNLRDEKIIFHDSKSGLFHILKEAA